MALADAVPRKPPKTRVLVGRASPRVAPPVPARSGLKDFVDIAKQLDIKLFPWQEIAARYLTARGQGDRLLYREVALIVARQNGKTTLLVPLIVGHLLAGRRVMHTAQDRALPREVFYQVAEFMWSKHPELFPERNGRPTKPRYANGQEEVRLTNSGIYSIVAPTRGGARGPSRDVVIIDELREMETWDFIAASKPTMTAAPDPQMIYLSNAGSEDSIVLNALRLRADADPALAWLEWSADPSRAANDRAGWLEANPAIGHKTGILESLEDDYRADALSGTLGIFETEHLCRWVKTLREALVDSASWTNCATASLERPVRPSIGVSMDPDGKRASVAAAWRQRDGTIALQLLFNVPGNPIDTDLLGADVTKRAGALGVAAVGFDPLTDAALSRAFRRPKPEPISGQKYANASAHFVNLITAGRLRWHDADAITDDLTWTARKLDREDNTYEAVRASDDHSITAVLAAIRAVWLASAPKSSAPKVY